ncbi:glycoside hydrolase family 3 protein [Niabella terrae]
MWNENLPVDQRVEDVLNRLTLQEKTSLMMHASPAITRLGIPAYDWWNETLHGVARTPYATTSYPQAIGMAATWDTAALRLMAHYCAVEGRAVHNLATDQGRAKDRYMGLTYWTPNINIFRDPRWGRGQETYGEDPYLTSMLGAAFVDGIQGRDSRYLNAAACAKHFAVHSGPEPSRHSDNFNPTAYDLWDTYLPAFKHLIVDAKVVGVMCAYNALNTQPCCANDLLMNDILRRQWKFTGYVTSDCWALDDFFKYHKTHGTAVAAAADALIHATDLECGNSVYSQLVKAVEQGLVKEKDIDASLRRLFEIRFRLGMFDDPAKVPLALTPASALEAPEHQAHALRMARESIVLLKNEKDLLPLDKKKIKKLVLIGPNADNKIAQLGNYNGVPSQVTTLLDGLRTALGPDVSIVYEKAINYTNDTLMAYNDISRHYTFKGQKGVEAAYFKNEELKGNPVLTRIEPDIDFFRAEGQDPAPGIPATYYSVRYTTRYTADENALVNFEVEGDDGYRVYIDDSLKVDAWSKNRWGSKQFSVRVQAGRQYKIVVEHHQSEGNASLHLKSGNYVKTDRKALLKQTSDADVIIFAGGISPQLEGEEMKVTVPGFQGGDRTSILLPAVQRDYLELLQSTGKPVVFVMMTGSAIAIPYASRHIPAILNAWYGGQSAGTAIADVLFGTYNPSGRLPVTFYAADEDLPDFKDYSMRNRTYRYFTGKPLYPFGYGLSYTRFSYSDLKIPATLNKRTTLELEVTVTNTGNRDGDEVAQVYLIHEPGSSDIVPLKVLKAFDRIHLQAGASRTLKFRLTPEDLAIVNPQGQSFQPSEKLQISVGGGQPGMPLKGSGNQLIQTVRVQ